MAVARSLLPRPILQVPPRCGNRGEHGKGVRARGGRRESGNSCRFGRGSYPSRVGVENDIAKEPPERVAFSLLLRLVFGEEALDVGFN